MRRLSCKLSPCRREVVKSSGWKMSYCIHVVIAATLALSSFKVDDSLVTSSSSSILRSFFRLVGCLLFLPRRATTPRHILQTARRNQRHPASLFKVRDFSLKGAGAPAKAERTSAFLPGPHDMQDTLHEPTRNPPLHRFMSRTNRVLKKARRTNKLPLKRLLLLLASIRLRQGRSINLDGTRPMTAQISTPIQPR
ncbi:hypothetical protein KC354_g38 [Hortaea werneckii]|nr:hypothetical protein KC354_g38 [Hortaea werneckii]